jgi:predicted anti-sigma-YlaC factor YlaD
MAGQDPERLDYAAPERQERPRFEMRWAGWVVVALAVAAIIAATVQWIRFR